VKILKRHLTVANVLSCTALFVALAGTAYAAGKLGPGQVKSVNIANQAVSNPKIKTQAVTSGKIKNLGINAADLGKESVINSKLAKKVVTSAKLADKAVAARSLANKAVTTNALAPESVNSAKVSSQLWTQLVKNVVYINAESAINNATAKSAEAVCPVGRQAIGGGARVNGELQDVAVTGSNPTVVGTVRTGWTAFGRDIDPATTEKSWSVTAFAVCAEL
jgi:hypothetical protein